MLKLYNSLTRKKEDFVPKDEKNVGMYVCGPTVYDRPHIGNARAVVVYDVLFRVLRHIYGENHVTYVRNITDVDDKIIKASQETGEPIETLTARITKEFHEDMEALGNLPPTREPKATEHIKEMIAMIEQLIKNGNAYVAEGHVLFDVTSDKKYGQLSGKKLEDLIAGARVEVESYKKNPGDFVLWKPSIPTPHLPPPRKQGEELEEEPGWDSPWGRGRPGWHIECSAMSTKYLGKDFDIHGGGADLKFPHHENEIAQSCCANPGSHFAKVWVHNGFVTVNGEKMAKSEGNFVTVRELLERGESAIERRKMGEVIRYALLTAKYNEPLDWTEERLQKSKDALDKFYRHTQIADASAADAGTIELFVKTLLEDLNTPSALTMAHSTANYDSVKACLQFLGFLELTHDEWFLGGVNSDEIHYKVAARTEAKKAKNYAEADRIRDELLAQGIILEDFPTGTTWRRA